MIGNVLFETQVTQDVSHGFLINELSYNVIKLHLNIAGKNIEIANYEGESLSTIKRLEELTKTDVITLLDLSTDKEQALNKYLADCYQELQVGGVISISIKQEMSLLQTDMQSCIVDKNLSDKAYFDAIDNYDQTTMKSSLTDSIKYENCSTENRIQYNAEVGIARKLVFYLGVLQKKYDVLSAKQDILAKNFTIFRDNILSDLNQINDLLQQYTF